MIFSVTRSIIIGSATIATIIAMAQPPITSDISKSGHLVTNISQLYPGRAPVFVPPVPYVRTEIVTNIQPLMVRETVWSNAWLCVVWHQNGQLRTNELPLATNFVSRTTNYLQ